MYVGSAMSTGNARSLARRLLRHATRTGRRRPHSVRRALSAGLESAGLIGAGNVALKEKRLRWHIDYLLDLYAAEITGVVAVRAHRDLEKRIARWLAGDSGTDVPCKGLGASDDPGGTHLFRVRDGGQVWERMVDSLNPG
jgi:Uri superfamily endonuclease